MIRRILIANRGEIALRVIRACRELDIESVAVFSDADRRALHVAEADRAVSIGAAAPAESYLSIPKIVEAARSTHCDAVHPGYGFLSENAAFAAACEDAGLLFIGPPASVIARMGSKTEARALMRDAGVAVVPGEMPLDQSDGAIGEAAGRVGFPAFLKAVSGGGGRGMRLVNHSSDLTDAIALARREAASAFGDGALYVERAIVAPRHVEVQILADHHGGVRHLFERDCSLQRRHQKIIEESPSPALTSTVRSRLTAAAVTAATAAGYRNAGTVEFLIEDSGDETHFYFLEMNTRLQVEHPVTELVTGLDLVRFQIAIAQGEPFLRDQASIEQHGHAIECRVYAEDPSRDFLPQAGRLLLYRQPSIPGVRIDSGVREGDEVPPYYDALLAKVIAWAETRDMARRRAIAALRAFPVLGLRTNIAFLIHVLASDEFATGRTHTGLAETLRPTERRPTAPAAYAAAAAHRSTPGLSPLLTVPTNAPDPWTALKGWRL